MTTLTVETHTDSCRIHIDLLPVATVIADRHGRAVAVNQAWKELTSRSDQDSMGRGWLEPLAGEDRRQLLDAFNALQHTGGPALGDYRLRIGRDRRWTRWTARAADGEPLVTVTMTDIDAERARSDQLRRAANTDSLTGLVNRGELLRLTREALARQGVTVGMCYIDLDGFKTVNDTGGHLFGDRVLVAAAARLHAALRPGDVLGRVGGDEFAVLCPDLRDQGRACLLAARLEAALADPIEADGTLFQLGATAGAAISHDAQTDEELLSAADRTMYAARAARHARCAAGDVAHDQQGATTIEVADTLIRRLFTVGLSLAATTSMVTLPAADRLKTAIRQLDDIIDYARKAAFDQHWNRTAAPAATNADTAALVGITGQHELLARHLDDMARRENTAGHEAIPLINAAHSCHRARTDLAFLADAADQARQDHTLN